MARTRLITAVALTVCGIALLPGTAGAAVITVNSEADPSTPADDGLCTLREALLSAQNNNNTPTADCVSGQAGPTVDTIAIGNLPAAEPDVITLSSSLFVGVSAGQGPVVIDGRGPAQTVVDANDTGRVFSPSGDTSVTLRDLTATNGTVANGNGGGIRSGAADLTFDNVTVSNNTLTGNAALAFGAGVSIDSGTLTVIDSTISGNTVSGNLATVRGGGIHMTGEGGATIDRTTISGNSLTNTNATQQVRGGGLHVEEAQATVRITNSTFSSNAITGGTSHSGGGIYWAETDLDGPQLELENATFSGNSAGVSGVGGAIFADGDAVIAHTTFGPNTAPTSAGLHEGAGPEVQVRNSVFETGSTDCGGGQPTSLGYNVEKGPGNECQFTATGDVLTNNTLLNALGNNGGPTQTHTLNLTGGALDIVPVASCLGTDGAPLTRDQRNAFRPGVGTPVGPGCDAGAVERNFCTSKTVNAVGGEGDDSLTGTASEDGMFGMGGNDTFIPGGQDDAACGGDGNDIFLAHEADNQTDVFSGDAGSDTISLGLFLDPATINLATGEVTGSNLGASVLSSIENATGGLDPDTLIGDAGPNVLDGFPDNDVSITGGGGSDTLLGNTGNDNLFARDGVADVVDCGIGTADTAQTDRLSLDTVIGCETVDALPEPLVTPQPASGPTGRRAAALKKCKKKKKGKARKKCIAKAKKLPV